MDRETLLRTLAVTIAGPADEQDARDPDDFDLEAIAEELGREAGGWDVQDVPHDVSGQPSRSTRGLLLADQSWARDSAAQELC